MRHPQHKTILILTATVVIMFSFSFAMAPLYNALCKATGINGKPNLVPYTEQETNAPDLSHPITVQFITTTNANLAWDFYPRKSSIKTHPDEDTKILFFVKNNTNKTMTVQAIPSITPWQSVKYFHKIECFCFTQQTLHAGESLEMPVVFRIDKQLPPEIHTITLAYTLFDVTKKLKRISA